MKKKVSQILELLKRQYPNAGIELNFSDNWQLLVAVILSAQCTDKRVNIVTPPLFKRYPSVLDFAECDLEELQRLIYSTGFYKNKAKNIKAAAQLIVSEFGGEVPGNMSDLVRLPGVGRKTGNVILNEGFMRSEGITVDTHVIRLSGLLGLASPNVVISKNAVLIEKELMEIISKDEWLGLSHLLIWHGRRTCIARRPKCKECPLNLLCPSSKI